MEVERQDLKMKPNVIKYTNYQDNQKLINGIKKLIQPTYRQAGEHVNHDIEICNELYTINSIEGELIAFFMVGFHMIEDMPCFYGGLSACKDELKNTGIVKWLYYEFIRECIHKELEINRRIITYWTTATPIVYYLTNRYWINVQPTLQGECSNDGKAILEKIAKAKYTNIVREENAPFVLRNVAQQINYSDKEQERIKIAIDSLNLTVFNKYKLDETNGDRFLMFGYTPSHDKLIEQTQ